MPELLTPPTASPDSAAQWLAAIGSLPESPVSDMRFDWPGAEIPWGWPAASRSCVLPDLPHPGTSQETYVSLSSESLAQLTPRPSLSRWNR
jgi:hypothetical protein